MEAVSKDTDVYTEPALAELLGIGWTHADSWPGGAFNNMLVEIWGWWDPEQRVLEPRGTHKDGAPHAWQVKDLEALRAYVAEYMLMDPFERTFQRRAGVWKR